MFEDDNQAGYIDRTPYALATMIVVAGVGLYALQKLNFRFNFGTSVGG